MNIEPIVYKTFNRKVSTTIIVSPLMFFLKDCQKLDPDLSTKALECNALLCALHLGKKYFIACKYITFHSLNVMHYQSHYILKHEKI